MCVRLVSCKGLAVAQQSSKKTKKKYRTENKHTSAATKATAATGRKGDNTLEQTRTIIKSQHSWTSS